MSKINLDTTGNQIFGAFTSPGSSWRSIGGIARETGLSTKQVQNFICGHSDIFRTSDIKPGGSPLYSLNPGALSNRKL